MIHLLFTIIYTWNLWVHIQQEILILTCEVDLHAGQQREGKMKCHDMATKTVVVVFMDLNQENLKYMNVDDAGKTPFESEMLMQQLLYKLLLILQKWIWEYKLKLKKRITQANWSLKVKMNLTEHI